VNALIIGRRDGIRRFLAASLVLPAVLCGMLAGVLGGAQLLGADLPDGTIHTYVSGTRQ